MKKSIIAISLLAAFILSGCASGKPRRPAPMKKSRRHSGSVVINSATPKSTYNIA